MVTARVRYASLSHRRLPETHAIAIFVWLALFYGCVFFLGGGVLARILWPAQYFEAPQY